MLWTVKERRVRFFGDFVSGFLHNPHPISSVYYISRPTNRTSDSISGAIECRGKRKVLRLLTDGGPWPRLYVLFDAPDLYYETTRWITSGATHFDRVLVMRSPGFAHALSLMAKWRFGLQFR